MDNNTIEILQIIIDDIEQYRTSLTNREDFLVLSPKYQQGVLDGMMLIQKKLEAVING